MSDATSKASYKRHAYSGRRKNLKRVRGGLRAHYGDGVESRLKAWRSEETKKKPKKNEEIAIDNSKISQNTQTSTVKAEPDTLTINNWPSASPPVTQDPAAISATETFAATPSNPSSPEQPSISNEALEELPGQNRLTLNSHRASPRVRRHPAVSARSRNIEVEEQRLLGPKQEK